LRLFNADTPDVKFLGIAGQFIPLNSSFLNDGGVAPNEEIKSSQNLAPENNPPKEEIIDTPDVKKTVNNNYMVHENIFQNQLLNSMLSSAYDQNTDQLSSDYGRLKLNPKPDIGDKAQSRKFNSQGLIAFQNADYASAESLFQSAYDQNHADPEVINNLGYAQLKDGKYRNAIASIQTTLLIAPDRPSAWFNLYEALSMQGATNSSICGSLVLGLKFSKNRQKSIEVLNQRIADESNQEIKQRLENGMNCAVEKEV
jgi:tetratricopeptide (TPR) repeat protein